ncbi:MAG TPA: hypothetical protein DCL74_00900 [Succinivibrionaceae bacterium]|nr:hypothetical protein [Succinivibrionaceae bacterium]
MLCLFINLDRSQDRLKKITNRLNELQLNFKRVPGIDGKLLSTDYCDSIQYKKNDPEIRSRYTRQLTPAEIGTFLSHRKCWQALLESNEKFVAILEDDLIISDRAKYYLNTDEWLPSNVDICRLICFDLEKEHIVAKEKIQLNDNSELICQLSPKPIGCQGYILSRKAAQFAIENSLKLPAPVDDFLFTRMFKPAIKFICWQLNPCIVKTDPEQNSEIGSRNKKDIAYLKAPFWIRHGLKRYLLKKEISNITKQGIKTKLRFE